MSKKPQPLSSQRQRFPVKKFWLILFSIVLVTVGLSVGKSLYDTYHDRPLAKGLDYIGRDYNVVESFCQWSVMIGVDYIGRDYNSGCAPFRILCFGPESEFLFYATNVKPDEVARLFPGWKMEDKQESLWYLPENQVENYVYSLVSSNGTRLVAAYYYFPDKSRPTQELNLLPTSKPYIIMVDRDEYEILRQADAK